MKQGKVKVLVFVSVLHAPREFCGFVEKLVGQDYDVHIVIGTEGIEEQVNLFRDIGTTIYHVPVQFRYQRTNEARSSQENKSLSNKNKEVRNSLSFLFKFKSVISPIFYVMSEYKAMQSRRKYTSELMRKISPDIYITHNFHSCGALDNWFLKIANSLGVLSVCLSVSPLVAKIISRPGRGVQYDSGMTGNGILVNKNWLSKCMSFLCKNWRTKAESGAEIYMWAVEQMIAAKIAGILPEDVWQVPNVGFDRVYAYNDFHVDLLRQSRFPMEKVSNYGPPRMDSVVEKISARKSSDDKVGTFILWNMEPSFEHHYCSKDKHWRNTNFIANELKQLDYPIVISLHPLCQYSDYSYLEEMENFSVSKENIEFLYPKCLFAVSFGCSTNYYASVFRKFILMYDWFGIRQSPRRWMLYGQSNLDVAETYDEFSEKIMSVFQKEKQKQNIEFLIEYKMSSPQIIEDMISLLEDRRNQV